MKKLVILLFVFILLTGCAKNEATLEEVVPEKIVSTSVPTISPTSIPSPISPSIAVSVEEELAQAMERASDYTVDVLDFRRVEGPWNGLPLVDEFPTVFTVITIPGSLPTEEQLQRWWVAQVAGVKRLIASDKVTVFYFFIVKGTSIQQGQLCLIDQLKVRELKQTSCSNGQIVMQIPPEALRFAGF